MEKIRRSYSQQGIVNIRRHRIRRHQDSMVNNKVNIRRHQDQVVKEDKSTSDDIEIRRHQGSDDINKCWSTSQIRRHQLSEIRRHQDGVVNKNSQHPTTSRIRRHQESDDIRMKWSTNNSQHPTTSAKSDDIEIRRHQEIRQSKVNQMVNIRRHQNQKNLQSIRRARLDDIKTYLDQRSSEEEDQDHEVTKSILFHCTITPGFVTYTSKEFRQQGKKTKYI